MRTSNRTSWRRSDSTISSKSTATANGSRLWQQMGTTATSDHSVGSIPIRGHIGCRVVHLIPIVVLGVLWSAGTKDVECGIELLAQRSEFRIVDRVDDRFVVGNEAEHPPPELVVLLLLLEVGASLQSPVLL